MTYVLPVRFFLTLGSMQARFGETAMDGALPFENGNVRCRTFWSYEIDDVYPGGRESTLRDTEAITTR